MLFMEVTVKYVPLNIIVEMRVIRYKLCITIIDNIECIVFLILTFVVLLSTNM